MCLAYLLQLLDLPFQALVLPLELLSTNHTTRLLLGHLNVTGVSKHTAGTHSITPLLTKTPFATMQVCKCTRVAGSVF